MIGDLWLHVIALRLLIFSYLISLVDFAHDFFSDQKFTDRICEDIFTIHLDTYRRLLLVSVKCNFFREISNTYLPC